MNKRKKFAFLIHPRVNCRTDFAPYFAPLGLVPSRGYELLFKTIGVKPLNFGTVRAMDRPHEEMGWLTLVPYSGRQMLELPISKVQKKIAQACDAAQEWGAEIIGLGAFTAPMTRGGKRLTDRSAGITNGNAFTAAKTWEALRQLLHDIPAGGTVALVGATGSVGSCLAKLLVKHRPDSNVLLVARRIRPLEQLKEELSDISPNTAITVTNSMEYLKTSDAICLMTSATENLLKPDYLKHGAVILDDTQPRNTDPSLLEQRPDIRIYDGGIVALPGFSFPATIGLPIGLGYACLAETMLLALDGHDGHFCIGNPTIEQVEHLQNLAHTHRRFGFHLAELRSFGIPYTQLAPQKEAIA